MAPNRPHFARKYFNWPTKVGRSANTRFGNVSVVAFMLVQALDGVLTYLGLHTWGPGVEGNPIVSSAVALAGAGAGVAGAKMVAVSFGMLLHLQRVHLVLAILTAFYIAAAIVPWTFLLFS